MPENFGESPNPENNPFEEFDFSDFSEKLNIEDITGEQPAKVSMEFRTPFGEGNEPSESEANLGAQSFHGMIDNLLESPAADQEMARHLLLQRSYLRMTLDNGEKIVAKIYRQSRVNDGGYYEIVSLHEWDENDAEGRGHHICDYSSGPESKKVTRTDRFSKEALELLDSIKLTDDNLEETARGMQDSLRLQAAMKLNMRPVGVEEISGLRNFLANGENLPPYERS
jgi:hypothetical protein